VAIPLHFLSVEHLKLEEKYGKDKGIKMGELYGLISGWGFFFFWMGIWFSPQPRFITPILQKVSVFFPVVSFSTPMLHLILCALFLVPGAWLQLRE